MTMPKYCDRFYCTSLPDWEVTVIWNDGSADDDISQTMLSCRGHLSDCITSLDHDKMYSMRVDRAVQG